MWGGPVAFVFQIQAVGKKIRPGGFPLWEANLHARKAGGQEKFLQKRRGEDGEMFLTAENEVLQPSADAFSFNGKIGKPVCVPLQEFAGRVFPMGTAQAVNPAGFQATKDVAEVGIEFGKMLNDMMRVKGVDGAFVERERVTEIRPEVALSAEHVGIHIDPAREIVLLARPQLDLKGRGLSRGSESFVHQGISGEQRAGEAVEGFFLDPRKHGES